MKYKEYKDSGINWIPSIPSHWEIKRIKDLGTYQSGDYINANDFIEEELIPIYGGNGFRGYTDTYNYDGNYILIGRQGALCGNIKYAYGKFWATEHAVVVSKNENINIRWFGELLTTMNLNQYSLSAAQPGLAIDRIKRLEVPYVNDTEEQTQIANYLDRKTAAIDKKIALLERKSSYYQELRKSLINETVCRGLDKTVTFKKSGIDGVGQIPEHWEVKRLKDYFKLYTGNSISDKSVYEVEGNTYPYIATKDIDINSGIIDYKNGIHIPVTNKSFKIAKESSTLLCIEGGSAGKKIAFTDTTICFVNKLCCIKSINKSALDKYLYFLFKTTIFENQFFSIINGLIGGVSLNLLKFFNIILPSMKEQIEIVEFLDSKTSKIDQINNNIRNQIDTLKELRKALINDVVTGQIRVTEVCEKKMINQ